MSVVLGDKNDTSQFVFRKGESFTAVVYSNTAGTIRGNVRVVYDDGTEDDFKFNETSSGSARAGVILTCAPHVTARPGIVVSMFLGVSGAINQRGMCFAQVWMTNDPQSSGAISLLAQGYIYIGSPLLLGVYVEPGPAGGPGNIRAILTANPAAAAEVVGTAVPSGAIWLLRMFTVQLVQGLTQTPLPTLRLTGVAGVSGQVPITGTAIGASSTAQLTWGLGLVQTSFTTVVGDEFHTAPLPVVYMVATEQWFTVTDGIGANTDYGAAIQTIEEW